MENKILVVDDEADICDILQFNLEAEGFEVIVAHSAEDALEKITPQVNLILLDVMMDGMSGFAMAEKLRRQDNHVPIIFLTAKNTENDMLTGFSKGGDDYIAKPFSIREVMARVKAVLKRIASTPENEPQQWSFEGLTIDFPTNRVFVDGKEVSLTKKEFEILSLLAKASPNILPRTEILDNVWGTNEFVLDRTVDVHLTRLRKKLGPYGALVVSRSGFGYYFNSEK